MYDAKGIILKQNNCRWHMTTMKSCSNISRFNVFLQNNSYGKGEEK